MYTRFATPCHLALATLTTLCVTGSTWAAGPSPAVADAQERYRQDMVICNSGQSYQDADTCRTEARNALAEAKRGGLRDASPEQYVRNAVQRCTAFQGEDRAVCEARVLNPSRVEGSVQGGGILRESTILVPAN